MLKISNPERFARPELNIYRNSHYLYFRFQSVDDPPYGVVMTTSAVKTLVDELQGWLVDSDVDHTECVVERFHSSPIP